ncbi:class I SAM-dependent methyltransferase [Polaribacter pectinis]|uniref:Class I SAM-dependent methyltransferase n=1 Tax=Polaribacter pectinis TaxID=2738844 RepID=A0A7G9LB97_9FLAO|nr:class I SAM-dependent methyltransferase [Polaribacter pectinis]QNM85896.1 class I SAM-dependent methyltransferase [Polaribacter pectinis]
MTKKYIYSNLTIKNRSFFKRFSHNKRFQKALELVSFNDESSVLDFGTGDGYFLSLLREKTKAKISGYEPVDDMFEQLENNISDSSINLINNLENVSDKFNTIYCLEVLEHFSEEYQSKLINEIKNKLKPNGKIVISVPVEVGFASLLKNIVRVSISQLERDTNFKNIIKALFYRDIQRSKKDNYFLTHIGFNYKKLENVFEKESLKRINKVFSPLSFLRTLNTQVFYVLKLKE